VSLTKTLQCKLNYWPTYTVPFSPRCKTGAVSTWRHRANANLEETLT